MSDIKQLTNGIVWNGKSITYLDVIKMTITLPFGSSNGHFYHISVIEFTIS